MDTFLLLRMRLLVTMVMVVVVVLLWQPVVSAQKPFSPYDSGSYSGKKTNYFNQFVGSGKTSIKHQQPRCLSRGTVCNPWDRSTPCCEGTTCRTYSDRNCMVTMGLGNCWCKPPSRVFGFVNWYRK